MTTLRVMSERALMSLLLILPLIALSLMTPAVTHAATIHLNTNETVYEFGDGLCTLDEAIVNANTDGQHSPDCGAGDGADVIELLQDVTHTYMTPTVSWGALPTITSEITINGNGSTIERDSSADQFSLVSVADTGNLTLDTVTIQGGSSSDTGGGIVNAGTLTLIDSVVSSNATHSSGGGIANAGTLTVTGGEFVWNSAPLGNGGAIYNYPGATLTVNGGAVFETNAALENGGGIFNNEGTVTVTESTFSENWVVNAHGGGIVTYLGELTVTDSTFSSNSSDAGSGGGIFSSGGTLTVTGSTFMENSSDINGGGIVSSGTLTVTNSTFSGNLAPNGMGGGIFINEGTVTVTNSTLSDNSADNGGGIRNNFGTLTVTDGTVFDTNEAVGNGAGIFNYQGELTVTGSTLSGNSSNSHGGGIFNHEGELAVTNSMVNSNLSAESGGSIFNNNGTLTVTNSTLSGNSADFDGAGIMNAQGDLAVTNSTLSGNLADNLGGGIASSGALTVTNSTLSGNSAGDDGGGIVNYEGTLTMRNSIVWANSNSIRVTSGSTTNVQNSIVEGGFPGTGNLDADPQFTTPIAASDAPTTAGDFALTAGSPAIDAGNNAAYNANAPGETDLGVDVDGDGVTDDPVDIDLAGNDRFTDGNADATATVDMGAYEIGVCGAYAFPYSVPAGDTAALAQAVDCANANTTADVINLAAGATYTHTAPDASATYNALPTITSEITINGNGATIERDSSSTDQFRILTVNATGHLTLTNTTVTGGDTPNAGVEYGGGIRNHGMLTVVNSTLSGNSGGYHGGGIANINGQLTVTNSTLSDNSADVWGGGIFNDGGALTVINSTLSGNSAGSGHGGGIVNENEGELTVTNSTLSGNSADSGNGGGIFNDGQLTVTNSTLSGNSAGDDGGGIRNYWGGTLTMTNSTLSGNSAGGDGGGIDNHGGTLTVRNSIVWANSNSIAEDGGTTDVQNSIVEGGFTGTGNLNEDPQFTTPIAAGDAPTTAGDFTLTAGSPAIDNGNDAAYNANAPGETALGVDVDGDGVTDDPVDIDLAGNDRFTDGNGDATATVDMGTFEWAPREINIAPDVSQDEGDSGTTAFVFTVSASGPVGGDQTIDWAVTGSGTGVADADDFGGTLPTGTATVTSGADTTTISVAVSGDVTVEPDETFTVTISNPSSGLTLGTATTATGTIVNDDVQYTLSYSAGPNGSLTGDTSQTVDHGADGTQVEAVPDTGYHFVQWSDNSTDNPRTDTNVQADVTVEAEFAIDTYTVTFVDYDGTQLDQQTVAHGSDATAPADPVRPGYIFTGWDIAFDNVTSDLTVTAQYEPEDDAIFSDRFDSDG